MGSFIPELTSLPIYFYIWSLSDLRVPSQQLGLPSKQEAGCAVFLKGSDTEHVSWHQQEKIASFTAPSSLNIFFHFPVTAFLYSSETLTVNCSSKLNSRAFCNKTLPYAGFWHFSFTWDPCAIFVCLYVCPCELGTNNLTLMLAYGYHLKKKKKKPAVITDVGSQVDSGLIFKGNGFFRHS